MIVRLAVWLFAAAAMGETQRFRAEWRGLEAGEAVLDWTQSGARLTLTTAGFARTLYKVDNVYTVDFGATFSARSSLMRIAEGRRRAEVAVTYRGAECDVNARDLDKQTSAARSFACAAGAHDILGALRRLMGERLEPGGSVVYPIANDRKFARVRVEAQAREKIRTRAGEIDAIRYEAHLMNGELYRRSGRLFLWLAAAGRAPARIRVQLPFYLGTVTLEPIEK